VIAVLAQTALADAGKASDLPLSHPVRAENLDDDPEVTVAARLKHVRTGTYALDNLAHVEDA
jgi:hypothetical protein